MNFAIYQAFARIPLGIAVTIEFLGPLTITVAGALAGGATGRSRAARPRLRRAGRGRRRACSPTAAVGHLNWAGVAWAVGAGAAWACYIIGSKATGQRMPGSSGLVVAMCVAAVAVTVPGVVQGGSPHVPPRPPRDRRRDRHPLLGHPVLAGDGGAAPYLRPALRRLDVAPARRRRPDRPSPAEPAPEPQPLGRHLLRRHRVSRSLPQTGSSANPQRQATEPGTIPPRRCATVVAAHGRAGIRPSPVPPNRMRRPRAQ